MSKNYNYVHPYHLVDSSPWPLQISLAILGAAVTIVSWITGYQQNLTELSAFVLIILVAIQWFRDIIREGKGGLHTSYVQRGLLIGFLLFVVSEIMLFFGFFWSFFNSAQSPGIGLGATWPPIGIAAIDPWGQPLLGTSILQASGFILTEGHEALRSGDKAYALLGFLLSILQGQAFLFIQYTEYSTSGFTIADNAFGTTFYMLTGLHFQHVQVGVIMLTVAMFRIKNDSITTTHAQGIDFAIYYWHFVDIVWQFQYLSIYIWGGSGTEA